MKSSDIVLNESGFSYLYGNSSLGAALINISYKDEFCWEWRWSKSQFVVIYISVNAVLIISVILLNSLKKGVYFLSVIGEFKY